MNKFLKSNLKIIIPFLLGLVLVCLSFNLVDQKEKVSAQNQDLVCDTKIPIGESVDRTSDLLNDTYKELETIYRTIPGQIQAAQEMIEGAQKCNLDNCKPVCVDISCYGNSICANGSPFCIAKCVEETCEGKICPDLEITNQIVNDAFEKINHSSEQINNLYGENTKEIERKLNEARTEFNNCAKITEARAIRCRDIFDQNGQSGEENEALFFTFAPPQRDSVIEECKGVCEGNKKTTEKCLECLCGNSINYFCCR
jgi:hypothetical protein